MRVMASVLVLFISQAAFAEELVIVREGKSDYRINVSPNDIPTERFAAQELAKYLKQMSGAELEVKKLDGQGPWILIACRSVPATDSPMSGTNADAYEITRHSTGSISITGATGRAVLRGVYAFLEGIGCRFLAPQLELYRGSGEVVPKLETIAVPDSVFVKTQPVLNFRKIYVEEGHSHTPENLVQMVEWMAKVGYNTLVVPTNYQGKGRVMWDRFREKVAPECQKRGITIEVGGHGYQNFLNAEMEEGKLFEQHPEWFAVDAAGKRQKAQAWVFNTSNAQAVRYLVDNFVTYIKAHPEIQIYDFWPPDGAKWCECEDCKKLGTPPDRQAILLAQVKEAAAKVRPDLRIEMIAYSSYVDPPEHATVDPSVLVDFCPINQQFDHKINDPAAEKNAKYVEALKAWRGRFKGDISIYSYYRKYAWDSLPVVIPHYMQKDLQFYTTLPVQGVSTYAEPGDWGTYELNHYVLAQLAWDPTVEVDFVVKKFCEARYGASAGKAEAALRTLEEITRKTSSIPNSALKSAKEIEDDLGRAWKLEAIREDAKAATDPAVKRALERLGMVCEYLRRDLELQKLRAEKGPKEEMRAKADELLKFVREHGDEGVFLVKEQRLSNARVSKRYGLN
jgi:hypothetical protein